MAAPIWITPAGNLGIIPDQEFFQLVLDAYNPTPPTPVTGTVNITKMSKTVTGNGTQFTKDLVVGFRLINNLGINLGIIAKIVSDTHLEFFQEATDTLTDIPVRQAETVSFSVIAGALPVGLHIDRFGNVLGIPINGEIEGVPAAITQVTVSTFTVRITNSTGEVADRTFNLTVSGVSPPEIVPKNVSLGNFFDGDFVDLQLYAAEFNPGLTVSWELIAGSLPDGVSLSSSGKLRGYINPVPPPEGSTQGFDASLWDQFDFDFYGVNISKNFQFTVKASDGVSSDTSTYTIFVYNKRNMTSDNVQVTGDNYSLIDASIDTRHNPVFYTLNTNLDPIRQGEYHAIKFDGEDFDGDSIRYRVSSGELPPGMVLNPITGWLTGYVDLNSLAGATYTFGVQVYKTSFMLDYDTTTLDLGHTTIDKYPEYASVERIFTLPVLGQVNNSVDWITDSNLGVIINGAISTFQIQATTPSGRVLQYRVLPGSVSRLPQGLRLLPDGTISGRVAFETFTLDAGYLTFDGGKTTFDKTYTFTVNAYDGDGLVYGVKTFTITISNANLVPYENLYIQALPTREQRQIFNQVINNSDIFPVTDIYRPADPWFGKNVTIRSLFLTGLAPELLSSYIEALKHNHYWKKINFGNIKTAQALDANFNVKYEVVYVELLDDGVNEQGQSPAANIALPSNSAGISNIYPNSFTNMIGQIVDNVGYANKSILPEWMTSRQPDGRVLGFTRAFVLCYTKPGKSAAIAYRVGQRLSDIQLVDFTVDRYQYDKILSANFDKTTNRYITEPETTFDNSLFSGCNGTITFNASENKIKGYKVQRGTINSTVTSPVVTGTLVPHVGTIEFLSNSTTITGSGTLFSLELGNDLTIEADGVILGTVSNVINNTELSIIPAQTSVSNVGYEFYDGTNWISAPGTISYTSSSSFITGMDTIFLSASGCVIGQPIRVNGNEVGVIESKYTDNTVKLYSNAVVTITGASYGTYNTVFKDDFNVGDLLIDVDSETVLGRILNVDSNIALTLMSNAIINSTDVAAAFGTDTKFLTQLYEANAIVTGSEVFAEITGSGTITSNTASNMVIGVGTSFSAEISVGQRLIVNNSYTVTDTTGTHEINSPVDLGTVIAISSNTSLTLDSTAPVTAINKPFNYRAFVGVVENIESDISVTLTSDAAFTANNVRFGSHYTDSTSFDYNKTKFFTNRSHYNEPGDGESYLKFPNVTITTQTVSS